VKQANFYKPATFRNTWNECCKFYMRKQIGAYAFCMSGELVKSKVEGLIEGTDTTEVLLS
jgi:hypothetical protein